MEGLQMALFDSEDVPSDEAIKASRTLFDAYHDALKYGHVAASKCSSYEELGTKLNAFADGVAIALGFDAAEREMVRNYAFAGADPVMQEKQH